MLTKEKFIKKNLVREKLKFPIYVYSVEGCSFGEILERLLLQIKSHYYAKEIVDKIDWKNVIVDIDYDSQNVDAYIEVEETDKQKDDRIKKEIIKLEKRYKKYVEELQNVKEKKERFEKREYERLRKKYG